MATGTAQKVIVACQGGGSLTAFTAGVLRTLLLRLDPARYSIAGLSGTSGGAICALLAWYGLLLHNPRTGADLLEQFWSENAATSPLDILLNDWVVYASRLAGSVALPAVSPYSVPEIGKARLREMLEHNIPFARIPGLVRADSPQLLISAVNEATGEFKLFSGATISVDEVLASAALPTLFRAVHIEEGPDRGVYWDGLFSQNPPIREFVSPPQQAEDKPDEIWIVRINPVANPVEPTTVAEIETRRSTLSGNLSLSQETYFIRKVNDWVAQGWLPREQFKTIRLREIALGLDQEPWSKWDRSAPFLRELMQRGERGAMDFLKSLP